MNERDWRAALRKRVCDRHQGWIREHSSQSLGDLADAYPEDAELADLTRVTGRLYRLFGLVEDPADGLA
jgi:hypothetical protein